MQIKSNRTGYSCARGYSFQPLWLRTRKLLPTYHRGWPISNNGRQCRKESDGGLCCHLAALTKDGNAKWKPPFTMEDQFLQQQQVVKSQLTEPRLQSQAKLVMRFL